MSSCRILAFLLTLFTISSTSGKPDILFLTYPHFSHISHNLEMAEEMVNRGYQVYYTTSSHYSHLLERRGIHVLELENLTYSYRTDDLGMAVGNTMVKLPRNSTTEKPERMKNNYCKTGSSPFVRLKATCSIMLMSINHPVGISMYNRIIQFLTRSENKQRIIILMDSSLRYIYHKVEKRMPGIWEEHTVILTDPSLHHFRGDLYYPHFAGFRTLVDQNSGYFSHVVTGLQYKLYMGYLFAACGPELLDAGIDDQKWNEYLTIIPSLDIFDVKDVRLEYIGLMSLTSQKDRRSGSEFDEEVTLFLQKHQHVVYISYGTLFLFEERVIKSILDTILGDLKSETEKGEEKSYAAIFSIKKEVRETYSSSFWNELESNPFFLLVDWIDQWKLLNQKNVRFMVTHGGLSSLTECIFAKKPTLVVPQCVDQWRHSSVIVEQGIGERVISLEELEPENRPLLLEKMEKLAGKESKYLENLETLNRLNELSGGAKRAGDLIEQYVVLGYKKKVDGVEMKNREERVIDGIFRRFWNDGSYIDILLIVILGAICGSFFMSSNGNFILFPNLFLFFLISFMICSSCIFFFSKKQKTKTSKSKKNC